VRSESTNLKEFVARHNFELFTTRSLTNYSPLVPVILCIVPGGSRNWSARLAWRPTEEAGANGFTTFLRCLTLLLSVVEMGKAFRNFEFKSMYRLFRSWSSSINSSIFEYESLLTTQPLHCQSSFGIFANNLKASSGRSTHAVGKCRGIMYSPPKLNTNKNIYMYVRTGFTFILQLRLFRITVGVQLLSVSVHEPHQPPNHWKSVRAMREIENSERHRTTTTTFSYKSDLEGIQQRIHTYILLRSNPATIRASWHFKIPCVQSHGT